MKAKKIYIVLILVGWFILNSCSSTVRFSSERFSDRPTKNNTAKVSKTARTNSTTTATGKTTVDNKTPGYGSITPVRLSTGSKNIVLLEAERWIGVPYKWGGEDSAGTDCSGFVQSVYKAFGLLLPRTASDQFDFSEKISEEDAVAGDLIFFKIDDKIVHVGLYVGNNRMIHASTKAGVIIQELSKYTYYSKKVNIAGFGRVASD